MHEKRAQVSSHALGSSPGQAIIRIHEEKMRPLGAPPLTCRSSMKFWTYFGRTTCSVDATLLNARVSFRRVWLLARCRTMSCVETKERRTRGTRDPTARRVMNSAPHLPSARRRQNYTKAAALKSSAASAVAFFGTATCMARPDMITFTAHSDRTRPPETTQPLG